MEEVRVYKGIRILVISGKYVLYPIIKEICEDDVPCSKCHLAFLNSPFNISCTELHNLIDPRYPMRNNEDPLLLCDTYSKSGSLKSNSFTLANFSLFLIRMTKKRITNNTNCYTIPI